MNAGDQANLAASRLAAASAAGRRDREAKNACPSCGGQVAFSGHLAAPGYGQAWECGSCGEGFWRANAAAELVAFAPGVGELSPEDVR